MGAYPVRHEAGPVRPVTAALAARRLPGTLVMIALAAAVALSALFPASLRAQEFPEPAGYVNDFANVIDDEIEAGLEDVLRLAEEETSAEIVTVTVQDLGGTTIEDYAVRLFEEWGIGQRGEDNGVMLIVAMEEREVRIEVGYGLEGVIPDGRAGRIIDDEVLPEFAQGNYGLGILNALLEIRQAIDEEGGGEAVVESDTGIRGWAVLEFLIDNLWLLSGIGAFTMYAFSYMARTRSVWAGAVWGGIAGWVIGWLVVSVSAGFVGLGVGVIIGLVLDAILSTAYRGQRSSGGSTAWRHTWGGFGGFNTGRSSGGGFGGFGGGRSGGGGASRRF